MEMPAISTIMEMPTAGLGKQPRSIDAGAINHLLVQLGPVPPCGWRVLGSRCLRDQPGLAPVLST